MKYLCLHLSFFNINKLAHSFIIEILSSTDLQEEFTPRKQVQVSDTFPKMKCVTKSCQRSKNILANGFCKTCDEAKKVDNPQMKKTSKAIEFNVKEIEIIYNKLKPGHSGPECGK